VRATEVTWQTDLLGSAAEPAVDAALAGLTRIALDARTWVDHLPSWVRGADRLMDDLLADRSWHRHEVVMYARLLPEPRLTSWWSLADGAAEPAPVLATVRAALRAHYRRPFDAIGFNLYRDGHDSVAWHGDRIRHVSEDPVVAIVSLGAPRALRLRPRGGGTSRAWRLGGGDLFVMGGACQHEWEHCVPKTGRAVGARLSVTFRHDLAGLDVGSRRKKR
jgi:alkylated DNA repair dioxygenase AlkB